MSSDVFVWGTGGYGRLGLPTRDQPVPAMLDGSIYSGREILCISAGLYHSAIVTDDNQVYLFGTNATMCLSNLPEGSVPRLFTCLDRIKIVQISVAGDLMGAHSLAVSNVGRLYAWGSGKACGLGKAETIAVPTLVTEFLRQDDSLETSAPERIVFASAGGSCSAVVTAEGAVFTFGISVSGRLGFRGSTKIQWRPRRIDALLGETVRAVSAGKNGHMLASTSRGEIFVWGENSRGQLGLGDLNDRNTPNRVVHPTHGVWSASISAGESHSLAVDVEGRLWTWGLGNKKASDLTLAMCISFQLEGLDYEWARPSLVGPLADFKVTRVAAGAAHSVAVTSDGLMFVWGAKDQLGHRVTGPAREVVRLNPVLSPAAVAAGNYHTMAASSNTPTPIVSHLLSSLTLPVCPASCDAHVLSLSGQKYFFPLQYVKSLITDSAWRSFWQPQVYTLLTDDSPKAVVRLSDLALEFNMAADEEIKVEKNIKDILVSDILDELVCAHEKNQLEIPKECIFTNLDGETVEFFFEVFYSNSLPHDCSESRLRKILPIAIVSQLKRVVALIQQRIKRLEGDSSFSEIKIPKSIEFRFDKKCGREVVFKCAPWIFRNTSIVTAHAFVVEAHFPRILLRDALTDTSPARFAKWLTGEKTGPNSYSVSCLEVPADVMDALVYFGYHSRFDAELSALEQEFEYLEPDSEERGIRFWLTVAAVAEKLGSVLAQTAAIDMILEKISFKNWLLVHLTRLRMRPTKLSCAQLDQTVLGIAIEEKVEYVTTHPDFVPKQEGYILSKSELNQIVDKLLADCPEVEDAALGYKIRSGVLKRIGADLEVSRALAGKLDHFNGLNLDPLGRDDRKERLLQNRWEKAWGSFTRSIRAMGISLRGGPSVGSTVRDLSLLGIAVAVMSMYVSTSSSLVKSLYRNYQSAALIIHIVIFFVTLSVLTKIFLNSKA